MATRKVIALNAIQRQPVGGGTREMIPAGAPFDIETDSEEDQQLQSVNAIRDAKQSDIARAAEQKLEVQQRRPRFRTRREIRAIQDSERDLEYRNTKVGREEDPGTGHGSPRSAVKSTETVASTKGKRGNLV